MLGLCWCMGFSLVAVQGLLTAVFSPAVEHRLDSVQAQRLWHMGFVAS